ncbi:hypothetical protein J5N97_013644 [Dioscorea zingiberensis]|uniref:Uncharacterized protein n=1 Tax=Dioscorea zingiberensis TaxID=325984 RepID=A0A9D5CQZ4_9LILI|nr:hypothetical protein J5N97_013644 [Dioscorea zingiberensis]
MRLRRGARATSLWLDPAVAHADRPGSAALLHTGDLSPVTLSLPCLPAPAQSSALSCCPWTLPISASFLLRQGCGYPRFTTPPIRPCPCAALSPSCTAVPRARRPSGVPPVPVESSSSPSEGCAPQKEIKEKAKAEQELPKDRANPWNLRNSCN